MKFQSRIFSLLFVSIAINAAQKPTAEQCAFWQKEIAQENQKLTDKNRLVQEQRDTYQSLLHDAQQNLNESVAISKNEQELVNWYKKRLNNDLSLAQDGKKHVLKELTPDNANNLIKKERKNDQYTIQGLENRLVATTDSQEKQEIKAQIDTYHARTDQEILESVYKDLHKTLESIDADIQSITNQLNSNQLIITAKAEINKIINRAKKDIEYYQDLLNQTDEQIYESEKKSISYRIKGVQDFLKECN